MFYKKNPKVIFEEILGKENAYKCALWAFGDGFESELCSIYPRLWNDLHKDKMFIDEHGLITEDIHKIIEIWKTNIKPGLYE